MSHHDTPPGRIGRYEIRGELGRGMMGVVYDAFDPSLGRHVALKVVHPTLATSAEEEARFERRFLTEARIAARLLHPGIVIVHDVGRDPSSKTLFLAMERVQGQTLTEIVASGQRPEWPAALGLIARVAEALHYAHEQGVVHRDVKPANIMVVPEGGVKVMDFGLAKIIEGNAEASHSGQWVGTPAFMSPEQVRGDRIDTRTDIFSLGSVAYTLVTGHRPFVSDSVPRLLEKITSEDPELPSRKVRGLPTAVDAVIARAMARDVESRYATANAFGEDLEDVARREAPRHLRASRQAWAEVTEEHEASRPLMDLLLRPDFDETAGLVTDGKEALELRSSRGAAASRSGSSPALLYLAVGMLLTGVFAVALALTSPGILSHWLRSIPAFSRQAAGPRPDPAPPAPLPGGTITFRAKALPPDARLRISVDGRAAPEALAAKGRPAPRLPVTSGQHEVFAELRLMGEVQAARMNVSVKPESETRITVTLAAGQLALGVE